ncbi:MAG: radical SAM protein [Candidatus Izemoplasmatales bacterium]
MINYKELKKNLLDIAYNNLIPIVGEFELLGNCNFNCPMCYAKTNDNPLGTKEWLNIFQQAYNNGMLYVLLTGGEVFLRPDFIRLYNYLFDMGVKITVYTNGSKLTDEILEVFKLKQPEMIVITLYGYDEKSYLEFTGVDSFINVNKNIDRIIDAKLPLILRTIPMPLIYENLDKMISYSKSKNLNLGYFLYVSNQKKILRLSTKELIDFEKRMSKAFNNLDVLDEKHYCGAFRNGFFINHLGYMQGCSLMPVPSRKVDNNFLEVFLGLKKEWDQLLDKSPCVNCEFKRSCFTCLAKRYLEGNIFNCADYLKAYAKEKIKDEKAT